MSLDHVLAFGGAYDALLARHEEGAEPMILVRRTFKGLLPSSAPRSLPGVQLGASSSSGGGGGGSGGRDGDDGYDKAGGKGKPPGGVKSDAPGSLKKIVKWVDETHAQIGISNFDVAGICAHYKIDANDFCVSNLSSKPGNNKFALCPKWGSKGHENAKSSAHTTPKNFNLKFINGKFMEKVAGKKRKAA